MAMSAYRERFPDVNRYYRHRPIWAGESITTYADAALTALAEALEQAEDLAKGMEVLYRDTCDERDKLKAELAAYRADQADDYSEDRRELERKYTQQMKRAEQAAARTEILDSAWNTANERSERLAAELAEKQAELDAMERDRDLLWDEKQGLETKMRRLADSHTEILAELAELKARRCQDCAHADTCETRLRAWAEFEVQPFACACYERREP